MTTDTKPITQEQILETQAQLRNAKHEAGVFFRCGDCQQVKPVQVSGGTGYGYFKDSDKPTCYDCCGKRDKVEMIATGKATLYLSFKHENSRNETLKPGIHPCGSSVQTWRDNQPFVSCWQVGNWPGTLAFNAYVTKGRHNIARTRYDAKFIGPDGQTWKGITYGENTQICHCKRIKG